MPKASSRPSLPTSSSDFALPPSSSASSVASSSSLTTDETNLLLPRFRRPSLLQKASFETRLHSPLAASATIHSTRKRGRSYSAIVGEESESDRDRMWIDSSPSGSSQNPTPPEYSEDNEKDMKVTVVHPLASPRRSSSGSMDIQDLPVRTITRRLSFPLRTPRIRNILAESRPDENEVKSEAAFQRLITSGSELPIQSRTPRAASDRGRYPEEAGQEECQREDTPSDDAEGDDQPFAFHPGNSEPIFIAKPRTPANSVNGDDLSMSISGSPNAFSTVMDVDMPYGSPSLASNTQWRYTPPPTTSAVRSNKRKFDDRFDPYPTTSKRRAVSPSISQLRESHQSHIPGRTANGIGRLSIPLPITIPGSAVSSAASSPTITCSYAASGLTLSRPVSISSSPTLRSSMGLASPILRPLPRTTIRRGDGEEKEIEGAGEAVGGLSIA